MPKWIGMEWNEKKMVRFQTFITNNRDDADDAHAAPTMKRGSFEMQAKCIMPIY